MTQPGDDTRAAQPVAAWLALLLLVLTVAIRLSAVDDNSITQDESTMVLFAQGVLERGYPFLRQADADFVISTYELVPYPIALSMALFGQTEFAVRLPSVLFAAGTVLLMLRFGVRLFNRPTAVLAALLFAVLPWTVYWGANAFYPSQVAFAALLATMAVHRLIVDTSPRPRDFYAVFAAVTLTYLTWEGSAGLLPTFFIVLLVLSWGRWHWIRGPHAWTAAIAIVFVVVAQLTWRTVLREPYQGVITGRSDVTFAKLAFTTPAFDPWYYPLNLASEAHLLIAASLLVGLAWWRRSLGLRYLGLVVVLYVAILTTLLGYYALRYVFLAAPLLLLMAAAATVSLVDRLAAGSRHTAGLALAACTALHLLLATPWSLQPVELSRTLSTGSRPNELRDDLTGFPFRAVAEAARSAVRPGDVLIVQAPFPFQVYTGLAGHYFLQTQTASSVFLTDQSLPRYTDKWAANPVLRSQADLDELMALHDRVWFVSAPDGSAAQTIGVEVYAHILRRFTLVHDTGDGRLFLWENPRAPRLNMP